MTFYVCDIIGDGSDAEGNAFRPTIADTVDDWHTIVDGRLDPAAASGKMLVKAASGLSGVGIVAMRRAMLADFGIPTNGFQDDADDPDLARHIARRLLLRQWLKSIDLPITLGATLDSLPGTLTQLRNRILALQPGLIFNGLTGSSTVGDALAVVLPQIALPLDPRQISPSGTFTDTFTDTNGTDLASHTPSGGTAWARVDGTAGWGEIQGNEASGNTTDSAGACYRCDDQGNAAHYVQSQWRGNSTCLILNRTTGRGNAIGLARSSTALAYRIFKIAAGTFTNLGTGASSTAVGDIFRLESSGNNHTAYLNGAVEIGPISDSHNNTVTRQGILFRQTTGAFVDDFEAGLLTAPVARLVNGGLVNGGTLMGGRLVREAA